MSCVHVVRQSCYSKRCFELSYFQKPKQQEGNDEIKIDVRSHYRTVNNSLSFINPINEAPQVHLRRAYSLSLYKVIFLM